MTSPVCPFCTIDPSRVFLRLTHVFAMWNGFPVTPGHFLIVPHCHVATWFDASEDGRAELFGAIEAVCATIRATLSPVDDLIFDVNVGPAAGQTVPHLYLHVIPRRTGDMSDPRGGVRHLIPSKGNYLAGGTPAVGVAPEHGGSGTDTSLTVRDTATPVAMRPAQSQVPRVYSSSPQLTTGESDPLLPQLARDLALASPGHWLDGCWPAAFDVGEAAVGEFQPEIGVALRVGCGADVLAKWVAGRDVVAAARPEALVRCGEGSAGLIDAQGEWLRAVDPVVGLAEGLNEASVDD